MAGGRGTRISAISGSLPKPLIPLNGVPVLERQIACLRRQGITDITLATGYRGEEIVRFFGDGSGVSPATGMLFGVHIHYFTEDQPLGSGGALFQLRDNLKDDFLLLNGDLIFDIDLRRFAEFHRIHGGLVTLFSHPNSHPYDSGLLETDTHGQVLRWLAKEDHRPEYYHNQVNAGLHMISPALLSVPPDGAVSGNAAVDLDRQVLKPLAGTGKLFAYESPEYVRDMGTPERYGIVCEDLKRGIVAAKNLALPQRAVFLDRDGVLNRHIGFVRTPDGLELLPDVPKAVRQINDSGFLAIVATNQPVVARGEATAAQLREIHHKLETLLGQDGAYLDHIYFCPHHPDRGFPGEVPELKTNCACRKPKPGMLLQAAEEFHLDLSSCWMAGDGERDIQAGKRAGCKTALIDDGNTGERRDFGQDITVSSLLEFTETVLKTERLPGGGGA